jgi:hypothetical protein
MHFHITKGFEDDEMYRNRKNNIDSARLDWQWLPATAKIQWASLR